jgi:hypothetical protein
MRAGSTNTAKISQIQNALLLLGPTSCAAVEIKHTPPEASGPGDEMSISVFGDMAGVGGVDGVSAALGLITADLTLSSPCSSTAVTA